MGKLLEPGVETCQGAKNARGKKVTKLSKKAVVKKQQQHGPKRKFVKDVITEVMGYTPYERRALELLRNQRDKRALKYLKKRLGTLQRAKKKREELNTVIISSRQ